MIDKLEEEVKIIVEEKEKALTTQGKLKEEYENVCNEFRKYEDVVKFAFVDTSFDELLGKNSRIVGTLYRLIAEKIVFNIYEFKIGSMHLLPHSKQNLDYGLKTINLSIRRPKW